MDILCRHCLEPWDITELSSHKRTCDFEDYIKHPAGERASGGLYQRVNCDSGTIYVDPYIKDNAGEWDFICQDAEPDHTGSCETCSARADCETCSGTGDVNHADTGAPIADCPDCRDCDDEQCTDGEIYEPLTCECGEEVANSWNRVTGVIGDGSILCLSCAAKQGITCEEMPCPECSGTGEVTDETAIGTPEDIARFRKGDGCPACDWGNKVLCECSLCSSRHYGYASARCNWPHYGGNCKGQLIPHASAEHDERRALNSVAHDINGDDLDGLAVTTEDHLK